jgi:hypothetical protein
MRILQRLVLSLLLLSLAQASGAAVSSTPVFVQTPKIGNVQFLQGTDSAGTYKTVYTGGTNGSKITGIFVTTNDATTSHLVTIQISSSTSAHCSPNTSCYGGVAVTIPVSSGYVNAAPAVNMMSAILWPGLPLDSDNNPYFMLPGNTYTIEATFATALTSTNWLNVVVVAADY